MDQSTIELLCCPETQESLELEATRESNGEIIEGQLKSGSDQLKAYAIKHGIPRFVPQEVQEYQTVQSFDQKWSKHTYYRTHTGGFYLQWYLQRYGFENLEGLRTYLKDKQFVLDAGTGSGRDATIFAENSDAIVFGADTSGEALQVASENNEHPNVRFIQADISKLPVPDNFFDFISCDQVIHHTADPRKTFEALKRKLRPGGEICVYVYRKKAVVREFVDDYVREKISKLPIDEALKICKGFTQIGKALADLNATIELKEDVPVLGIKKGSYDVQRFVHWNIMKCFWNDDFDEFTNDIVNVDWYHPEFCYRYEPDEFRAWFNEGWDIITWDEQEAGLSCRARKLD